MSADSWETHNNDPPSSKTELITLYLCESDHLLLRPNVLYLFTVKPDCARCVELEQRGRT